MEVLSVEEELLREVVQKHGTCRLRVRGHCMAPAIRDGAEISVDRISSGDGISVGDILAYFYMGEIHVHRVIHQVGDSLQMKGDAGKTVLHLVTVDSVLGKLKSVRNRSFLQRLLRRTPNGKSRNWPGRPAFSGATACVCQADG